jgi:hypothetical protein
VNRLVDVLLIATMIAVLPFSLVAELRDELWARRHR